MKTTKKSNILRLAFEFLSIAGNRLSLKGDEALGMSYFKQTASAKIAENKVKLLSWVWPKFNVTNDKKPNPYASFKLPLVAYPSFFFINLLALVLPLVILQVYDRILPNQSRETLLFLILGLTGVIIIDTVMKISRSYLVSWAAMQHDYKLKVDAVKRMLYAPESSFNQNAASTHIDRLNALDTMRDYYGGEARLLLLDLPFVAVFLGFIYLIGGFLVLVPIVLFIILGLATLMISASLRTVYEQRMDHDERGQDFIIESLVGIATIKTMAMEPKMLRRFERLRKLGASTNHKMIMLSNSSQTLGNIFANLSMVSVVSVGALMVIDGNLTVGALAGCTLLSGRTIQPLLRAIALWTQMQTISVAESQMQALFELPKVDDNEMQPQAKIEGNLSLRDLSFGYEAKQPILSHINLEIPLGTIIGVKGSDGSGKSILLKLISGALDPTTGEILIDGLSMGGEARQALDTQIAYIGPKSEIFHGTIIDNLTMFQTGKAVDFACQAAQLIGLEENIHRMPEGYKTVIGAAIAEQLPAGMTQRIGIARALSRRPKILLLDEANSSLDGRSDWLFKEGLKQLKGEITIVLVSNRPSTLQLADHVYEIVDGSLQKTSADDNFPIPVFGLGELPNVSEGA